MLRPKLAGSLSGAVMPSCRVNLSRSLASLLAVIYIVAAFFGGGAEAGFLAVLFVILPLSCIWFSEPMGSYVGPTWRGAITAATPGLFVCMGGWLLLLLPLIIGTVYALLVSKA